MQNRRATVILADDMKSATVIAVNGSRTSVVAQTTMSMWARKDGGYTFRTDANHRSLTVRVDRFGRIFNTDRDTFATVNRSL